MPNCPETIKQAMDDWDNATDEQRTDALAKAAELANAANHHPDDVAAGNLPTDTERAQGGDDDPPAERASDLIYDGIGLRARGGLVYFA